MHSAEKSQRSGVKRRPDYVPTSPQEEFIVPLLKQSIESRLKALASNASAKQSKPVRVLDAGCGRQPFRHFFESPDFVYHSFDVQTHEGEELDYVGPLDGELPRDLTAAEPFDFILCTEVLEHVADWNKAYENLSSLLAPGGQILMTIPHFYPLHEEPYDFWRPTRYAVEFYAKRYGMKLHEYEALGDSFDILGTLLARQVIRAKDHYRFWDRQYAKIARMVQERLRKILTSRRLQKHLVDLGPLYISNLAVLRHADDETAS